MSVPKNNDEKPSHRLYKVYKKWPMLFGQIMVMYYWAGERAWKGDTKERDRNLLDKLKCGWGEEIKHTTTVNES